MVLDKKLLIIPFVINWKKIDTYGDFWYFIENNKIVSRTIVLDGQKFNTPFEPHTKIFKEKFKTAPSSAYLCFEFSNSNFKYIWKNKGREIGELVFATILSVSSNDRCLKGVYKYGDSKKEGHLNLKESDYKKIKIEDFIKEDERFRELFYSYNFNLSNANINDIESLGYSKNDIPKCNEFLDKMKNDVKRECPEKNPWGS